MGERKMAICGVDCCKDCSRVKECGGCTVCNGHPFGGSCIAAECIKTGGFEACNALKNTLIEEINSLGIKYLYVDSLNLLNGFLVNLEYVLPNGEGIKLLNDNDVYLGNQIEKPNSDRCYGVVTDSKYLLVCEYGCNGLNPEIVSYKRR